MKQKIALLGSTGSIGEQTLKVVRNHKQHFEITTLTANRKWQNLSKQAREFMPDSVVIADPELYPLLKEELKDLPIKVYAGKDALTQVVRGSEVDIVVNAIVGYAGLDATISTLEVGKKLALANKESLVVAGDIVMQLARQNNAPIIPVDSEHSALFQCLVGETTSPSKVILTASGGPFLKTPIGKLKNVTVEQALAHPNWEMGSKITIDSATMLNKGLEVIEAHWLFDVEPSKIEVVIHPQSIVHSLVEFADGALKAQLGTPDMYLPIQYALTFPHRFESNQKKFSFANYGELTFLKPDVERFPALRIAYKALASGGNSCCVMNAANEVAVDAFLKRKIGFADIVNVIERTLAVATHIAKPTLEDYRLSNDQAREIAESFVVKRN